MADILHAQLYQLIGDFSGNPVTRGFAGSYGA